MCLFPSICYLNMVLNFTGGAVCPQVLCDFLICLNLKKVWTSLFKTFSSPSSQEGILGITIKNRNHIIVVIWNMSRRVFLKQQMNSLWETNLLLALYVDVHSPCRRNDWVLHYFLFHPVSLLRNGFSSLSQSYTFLGGLFFFPGLFIKG